MLEDFLCVTVLSCCFFVGWVNHIALPASSRFGVVFLQPVQLLYVPVTFLLYICTCYKTLPTFHVTTTKMGLGACIGMW